MKEILDFLRDLDNNNHREWFNANKGRYQEVLEKWYAFCESLITEIGRFDKDIAPLTIKDCTYRIYRDTRFSKDKSPYKTHFGAFLAKKGARSRCMQDIISISELATVGSIRMPTCWLRATTATTKGLSRYCVKTLATRWETFSTSILGKADAQFVPDMEGALKRVPREYDPSAPYADWMRMRAYCLTAQVDDDFLLEDHLAQRVAELFKTTKPFVDYINRAVDYVNEEMEG